MRAEAPALSWSVMAIQQAFAVAATQLTLMWRERRVLWLALALLLIAGASVLSGAARLTLQAQERQAMSEEEARLWDSQGTIDPHSAAHVGRAIAAPVRPLAALDPGLTDYLGTSVFIEGHAQNPARHRAVDGGTALSRFEGFSAAWALQVVAPLLIILAGFATLSGDVARETLRQELGTGASAGVLICGRLIALAAASLLLVLAMLLISLPGLSIQYGDATDLAALLALAAAYLLYLLVFCALTVGVSALAGSARTSLVVLLGFWVVSTLLLPRVAPAVAESLYPTPSAPAFRTGVTEEAENGADGHDPADKRLDALRTALMARYRVDSVDDLPLNFRGVALEFAEANSTRVYNRHFDRLHATYQQQDATQRLFGLASPTLALQSWSRAFAGTDFPAHLAFLRGVEDYRYRLIQALNQEVKLHKAPQGGKHVADIAGITRSVHYLPPQQTLAGTATAQRGNLVILLAWLMLGCVVVLISARKLGEIAMNVVSIACYEIRRLLRDRALPVLLVLLLGLGAYAAWNGRAWVDQREAAIALIKQEEQQTKERSRAFVGKAPSVLPRAQPVLAPAAMAPLSIGQADAYPYTADVVALGDPTQLLKHVWADIGNPAARAAGRFDLAFVIVFLLPLVILVATHDLWSRERERGIAALVLSQPVSATRLLVVKVLARGLMVLLPALAILLAVTIGAGARSPAGLAMLALTVLLYGAFWLALALLIGCLARRTTEAAIAAGALWLLIVVMAPSLALATVNLIAPPPSQMQFATEVKAMQSDIATRQQREHARSAPVNSPSPVISDTVRQAYADRVAADRELERLIASHAQAEAAHRQVLDKVRLLLPAVATQDALDRIAGSDADRALDFQGQVHSFWLARRLLHKAYLDRDAPQTFEEYDTLPRFQFHETAGVAQRGVLADLAALIIATLLVLLAAGALRSRLATP